MNSIRLIRHGAAAWLLMLLTACSTAYYATWETLGKHKRDLLRDEVEAAREDQSEAQEQFKDALTRLQELTGIQGGELQERYDALKKDYDKCVDRAGDVTQRIESIEEIADDLFAEWRKEIDLITQASFREDSRKKLGQTQAKYEKMRVAMRQSETRMNTVLGKFRDHVLYLKHNLNAQVVGGLSVEVTKIEGDVTKLIADMQSSIKEADAFLKTL